MWETVGIRLLGCGGNTPPPEGRGVPHPDSQPAPGTTMNRETLDFLLVVIIALMVVGAFIVLMTSRGDDSDKPIKPNRRLLKELERYQDDESS